jgi:hypothetical protein
MPEAALAHAVLTLCARVAEFIERDLRTAILNRIRRPQGSFDDVGGL